MERRPIELASWWRLLDVKRSRHTLEEQNNLMEETEILPFQRMGFLVLLSQRCYRNSCTFYYHHPEGMKMKKRKKGCFTSSSSKACESKITA